MVALDLPETGLPDPGALVRAPGRARRPAALPPEVLLGALHATEHCQIAVLPLLAMCDRWDIGGLSTNVHFQTGRPTIFIYDGHPGGVGIARRGFEEFERLVADAARWSGSAHATAAAPLRAEPEVRKPQRAPPQAGSAGADGGNAGETQRGGAMTRPAQISVIGKGTPDPEAEELARDVGERWRAREPSSCAAAWAASWRRRRGALRRRRGRDRHRALHRDGPRESVLHARRRNRRRAMRATSRSSRRGTR